MPRQVDLNQTVKDIVTNAGAIAVGITTVETLAGGPPSADLTRVLPEARSAVTFALPLCQDYIAPFLGKKDYAAHCRDNILTNHLASGIALDLAGFLDMRGFLSVPVACNFVYRKDTPRGTRDELPEVSHRYLAVRSGVGHFGLSGNVLHPKHGAAIILGSVITEAELTPTEPLPEGDNYCDECRLCLASCASGLMDQEEKAVVTLGGRDFSYAKRRAYDRCDYVCGGFTGLHGSGQWSTWSPARFPIPEQDHDFYNAIRAAAGPFARRPKMEIGFYHALMPGLRGEFTCGHCQLVCHPDKEVRKKRHKILVESGVVIQDEDGSRRAVSPDQAESHLEAMPPERRALFEAGPKNS
ncbi:MAG: epoxyqueuosine reductase [Proteobacteria bacterium]|nr:epoxyqueuosine reductase [Pseudomonadota bacterium]MBU1743123.1 epoxyqueuosine reductase [Pseudomonadota bacterium]